MTRPNKLVITQIRRYCKLCKHTTMHDYFADGGVRCLAAKHRGFRSFIRQLRKDGFKKDWETRSKINGRDLQFSKPIGDRRLVVQLWQYLGRAAEGRATHDVRGCSDTVPSVFKTVNQMQQALKHETSRKDNGWINGTKKFYSSEQVAE